MTYLSALLEKHPYISGPQPQSHKVTVIKDFLDKVVNVVPLESVGYAMAHGNDHVAQQCVNVVDAIFNELPSSYLMDDGFDKAISRVGSGMSVEIDKELLDPIIEGYDLQNDNLCVGYAYNKEDRTLTITVHSSEETLTHTYSLDELEKKYKIAPNIGLSQLIYLKNLGSLQSKLFNKMQRSGIVSSVICGLNISSLYGASKKKLKSPIETLQLGKEKTCFPIRQIGIFCLFCYSNFGHEFRMPG